MGKWVRMNGSTWVLRQGKLLAVVECRAGGWTGYITDTKRSRQNARSLQPTTRSRKARRQAQSMLLLVEKQYRLWESDRSLAIAA
jgi:hypothetical protein